MLTAVLVNRDGDEPLAVARADKHHRVLLLLSLERGQGTANVGGGVHLLARHFEDDVAGLQAFLFGFASGLDGGDGDAVAIIAGRQSEAELSGGRLARALISLGG